MVYEQQTYGLRVKKHISDPICYIFINDLYFFTKKVVDLTIYVLSLQLDYTIV